MESVEKEETERSRVESAPYFYFTGNCVAFPVKQKELRVDRTAAERNLSLRDPPQAENPAPQDSIFKIAFGYNKKGMHP